MTHWSKLSRLFVMGTFLWAGAGYGAAVTEEPFIAGVEEPIGKSIRGASTLGDVYKLAREEYGICNETYEALKGGSDKRAQAHNKKTLESLYEAICDRCSLLTGICIDEKSEPRIKRHFFTEATESYETFEKQLHALIKSNSTDREAVSFFSDLIPRASQRAMFFKDAFSNLSSDSASFNARGTGAELKKLTGFSPLASMFDFNYYGLINRKLIFLSVQKEDIGVASDIISLLQKFHLPLGIQEEISYGPYMGDKFRTARDVLTGSLPLEIVNECIKDEDFKKGFVSETLKAKLHALQGSFPLPGHKVEVMEEDASPATISGNGETVLQGKEKEETQDPRRIPENSIYSDSQADEQSVGEEKQPVLETKEDPKVSVAPGISAPLSIQAPNQDRAAPETKVQPVKHEAALKAPAQNLAAAAQPAVAKGKEPVDLTEVSVDPKPMRWEPQHQATISSGVKSVPKNIPLSDGAGAPTAPIGVSVSRGPAWLGRHLNAENTTQSTSHPQLRPIGGDKEGVWHRKEDSRREDPKKK